MDKAYVECLVTGEVIEVLDAGKSGYVAAREAARRDGAPMRIKWACGKGVNQARVDAGELIFDFYEMGTKRYVFECDHM